MHGRIGDVFDGYADVPFPDQDFFIIAGGDHFGALIFDEGDGVDGRQMMIVFLRDFSGGGIVSDDFVVGTPHHEKVVVVRIELYHVRHTAIGIRPQNLSGFRIPQTQIPIERRRKELCPIRVELHVPHGGIVSHVRPHQFLFDRGPDLARTIQPGAQEQMPRAGKEANAMNSRGMSREAVDAFFGDVAGVIVHVAGIDALDAGGGRDPRSASVVQLFRPVEGGGRFDGGGVFALQARREEMGHFAFDEAIEFFFFVVLVVFEEAALSISFGEVGSLGEDAGVEFDARFDGGDGFGGEFAFGGGGRGPDAVGDFVVGVVDEGAFGEGLVFLAGAPASGFGRLLICDDYGVFAFFAR
mmetsp:Transcript_24970/g.52488  ORF Transcript_24970/g.52488 Transcript_24970/m.52488 type:complete len:355 (-) Transcript_24970:205-1269(-)